LTSSTQFAIRRSDQAESSEFSLALPRGHNAIGRQTRLRPLDRFFENPFEGRTILRFPEDCHPRVGAVEDMINQSAVGCSVTKPSTPNDPMTDGPFAPFYQYRTCPPHFLLTKKADLLAGLPLIRVVGSVIGGHMWNLSKARLVTTVYFEYNDVLDRFTHSR
jgi:hypothetical protein